MSSPILSEKETKRRDLICELIYAGHALAQYFVFRGPFSLECICGPLPTSSATTPSHEPHCPVGRFYAAVLQLEKEGL
jgi:hypothetical protein